MASSMRTSLYGCGQLPFPLSKNCTADSTVCTILLRVYLLVTTVSTYPIVSFMPLPFLRVKAKSGCSLLSSYILFLSSSQICVLLKNNSHFIVIHTEEENATSLIWGWGGEVPSQDWCVKRKICKFCLYCSLGPSQEIERPKEVTACIYTLVLKEYQLWKNCWGLV